MQEPKIYSFKGLNCRESDILRDQHQATNLLNVFVDRNKKRCLRKRYGSNYADNTDCGYGIVKYIEDDYLIGFGTTPKKITSVSSPAWTSLQNPSNLSLTAEKYKAINVKKNLYFLSENEKLLKFDGINFYRAGMPNPDYAIAKNITASSIAGTTKNYRYRYQFMHVDRNEIYVYSDISYEDLIVTNTIEYDVAEYFTMDIANPCFDYDHIDATDKWLQNTAYTSGDIVLAPDNKTYLCHNNHTSSNSGTALEDFKSDKLTNWYLHLDNPTGYNSKYAKINGAQSDVNTITVHSGHNYVVGDKIVLKKPPAWVQAEAAASRIPTNFFEFNAIRTVTAVTATSITFDGDSYYINFVDNEIISNIFLLIYQKNVTDAGDYLLVAQEGIDPNYCVQNITIYPRAAETLGTLPTYSQTPNLPPLGSDLALFQNLLFIISGDYEVSYQMVELEESFPSGDNALTIGSNDDGKLIALATIDDCIFFLKEYDVYFGTGTFGSNQGIRIWPSESEKIGCNSRDSVQVIGKYVIFLSERGFYWVSQGSAVEEIGWEINNIIIDDKLPESDTSLNLDFDTVSSFIDTKRKHYLCYIKGDTENLIFVLDYYEKQWYIFSGIRADGGIAEYLDKLFFQSTDASKNLYIESSTRSDDQSAIEAYWDTHWHNSGIPSHKKKFTRVKIYSLHDEEFSLTVRSQIDWVDTYRVTRTINFDSTNKVDNAGLDKNMAQSLRIRFHNNIVDEDMVLTGYDIKTEPMVKEMRKR